MVSLRSSLTIDLYYCLVYVTLYFCFHSTLTSNKILNKRDILRSEIARVYDCNFYQHSVHNNTLFTENILWGKKFHVIFLILSNLHWFVVLTILHLLCFNTILRKSIPNPKIYGNPGHFKRLGTSCSQWYLIFYNEKMKAKSSSLSFKWRTPSAYRRKGGGKKISRAMKNQDREIVLSTLSVASWGAHTQGSPQGTLQQEPHVKIKIFFGETLTISWKMPTFLEYFRPFSCTQVLTCSQLHLASLTSTAQQRTKMVGKSLDVLTKRVLIEKHISGIMNENTGGPQPPLCRRPCVGPTFRSIGRILKANCFS